MKATLDTNVLVRLMIGDDEAQQAKAVEVLEAAEVVAVSVHSLCEFSWVLGRSYGVERADIASAIRHILNLRNVVTNRPMVEAGLDIFEAGGDFADGAIAFGGQWLGGETFVSFDKKAVRLLKANGLESVLLT